MSRHAAPDRSIRPRTLAEPPLSRAQVLWLAGPILAALLVNVLAPVAIR